MKRALLWFSALGIVLTIGSPGCMLRRADYNYQNQNLARYETVLTETDYPDVASPISQQAMSTLAPLTLPTGSNDPEPVYWDLSVEEAVQFALQNSAVLRDLGGAVLQGGIQGAPVSVRTIHGPAIVETDPRFGVDAALAAFDTSFSASAFFEKNDRALNNQFFGGGTRILVQDLHAYKAQFTKYTAYGTQFTARHTMDYDANNAPGNQFFSAWTTYLEGEFRQPLLQGLGPMYNRIAGPGAVPGVYNGVLIARINTDISLAEFELGVRNMVNDVEIAYWELYFAYRDLDTKVAARDRGLETWRIVKSWYDERRRGGEADKEAQAREQYYRLEEEVQNAVSGRLEDRIRVIAFRGQTGVQQAERRLRLLIGVPITDGRLIRPNQDPKMAKVMFQWDDVLSEALTRREELRRQKWFIKRREMELLASRNFLYPKLDALGRYRWRGFGQDLLNSSPGQPQFDNAFADLVSGNFQEWQLGFEFSAPIGQRKAHAAIRNAELLLARDRAVLDEQEREIAHDVSNAVAEMDRAYAVAQTNYNRRLAASQQLEVLESNFKDADGTEIARLLDLLLDAQRRLAESESKYFRSMVEHELAVKNVHYQKGSLLDYNDIVLAEGGWPEKAYSDAARRAALRGRPWELKNFVLARRPEIVSQTGPATDGYGGMNIPAGYDPVPTAGFDHMPPGSVPQPVAEPEVGFAPQESAPVRVTPDPSLDYSSGVTRPAAAPRKTSTSSKVRRTPVGLESSKVVPAAAYAPVETYMPPAGFDAPK